MAYSNYRIFTNGRQLRLKVDKTSISCYRNYSMRFSNSAGVALVTATLFIVPLYSVYAVDSTSSARFLNLQNRQSQLNNLQANFDDRIAQMKDRIASREAQFNLK